MTRAADLHRRLVSGEALNAPLRMLLVLLIPLAWIYGAIVRIRARLYRSGRLSSYRAAVPVISVGNLSAGGTGKTPTVDYIVRHLRKRGKSPAVVSRGYGGTIRGAAVVNPPGSSWLDAAVCGDEPLLLASRNPETPVLVAPRREAGIRKALAEFDVDAVILDDAFQHLQVERDLDIVLLDAERPFGNGRVLPAGVLREPPAALERADLLVLTRFPEPGGEIALSFGKPVIKCRHRLSETARDLNGHERPLSELALKKGLAFAGIADPQAFFRSLRERGLENLTTLPFSDHAVYDEAILRQIASAAAGADFLVTTEKDGVKLRNCSFPLPCYEVPMEIEFVGEGSGRLQTTIDGLFARETA